MKLSSKFHVIIPVKTIKNQEPQREHKNEESINSSVVFKAPWLHSYSVIAVFVRYPRLDRSSSESEYVELYLSDESLAEDAGVGDDRREDEHDASQDPEREASHSLGEYL